MTHRIRVAVIDAESRLGLLPCLPISVATLTRNKGKLMVECPKSHGKFIILKPQNRLKIETLSAWANRAPNGHPGTENRDDFEVHLLHKPTDFRRQGFEAEVLHWSPTKRTSPQRPPCRPP